MSLIVSPIGCNGLLEHEQDFDASLTIPTRLLPLSTQALPCCRYIGQGRRCFLTFFYTPTMPFQWFTEYPLPLDSCGRAVCNVTDTCACESHTHAQKGYFLVFC